MNKSMINTDVCYCEVCNTPLRKIGKISYFDDKLCNQELFLCDVCGLISTNTKIPFEKNLLAIEKDNYLSKVIELYVKTAFSGKKVGMVNANFSHVSDDAFRELIELSNNDELLIISEYLEHTKSLFDFLNILKTQKPKYIVTEVPVYDFYDNSATHMYDYFIKSHNYYFSSYTIAYMMASLGYSLFDMKYDLGIGLNMPMVFPCALSIWVKNSNYKVSFAYKPNIMNYILQCEKEIDEISKQIDSILPDDCPIAVWGAGNYFEKLFAMTSLNKKNIVKIYDGNSLKWGKVCVGQTVSKFDSTDIETGIVNYIFIASNTAKNDIFNKLVNELHISENCIKIL